MSEHQKASLNGTCLNCACGHTTHLGLQVTTPSTINLQVSLHQGLVIASNYQTDKQEKCWQLKCTSLPTRSHLLQFVYRFFAPLHPLTVKSHRSSHWFKVITLVATGLQRGRGLGLTRPVIRVQQKPASVFNSSCDGVLQLVEPLGFHYTKTNGWSRQSWILGMGRAGWRWGGGRQLAYSVVACLKWCVSMQRGDMVRGGAQQRKWHICPLVETANCGTGSKPEK